MRTRIRQSFQLRAWNLAASGAVVILACMLFVLTPDHRELLAASYGVGGKTFSGLQFLAWAAVAYLFALATYYLADPEPRESKSLRFVVIAARFMRAPMRAIENGLPPEERLALLSTLLKCFFGPMMVLWLMTHCMSALSNAIAMRDLGATNVGVYVWFNSVGFWFLMQCILFVDVFLFTVGYLIESRQLGNEIRSVDPTLMGWAVTLLCYPPFNTVTGKILGAQVSDFPQFDDPSLHLSLNLALLILMAIYASASVALGLKASNLTHRGIISRGPYAAVRHPAYACKNMAWWIGSAPLVSAQFAESILAGLLALASVAGWTLLYVLRAMTEEDHLRSVDGEYAAYAAKVRYRFIPGIY